MAIRRLSPQLVNQIAAGEVIERPASVVQELVENAIDAGAARVHATIEQGGMALVRVTDDGRGIPGGELALALAPHATSKIQAAGDLDRIATMGFRGEALAAIASVSRFAIVSRSRGQETAWTIEGEGGDHGEARPAAGASGTSVTVRSLFFNMPGRRKFLKTDRTEGGRVGDVFETLALSHPSIAFRLDQDGRPRVELAHAASPRERVAAVLGAEQAEEFLELSGGGPWLRLWGLAGTPAAARATSRHQRVFVNGRSVVDRTVAHAIREAYRGLIDPARVPSIVLFIEIDPSAVDVNVHPAKAEVRFRDQSGVHRAVLKAVRDRLRAANLTPTVELKPTAGPAGVGGFGPGSGPASIATTVAGGPRGFDARAMREVLANDPEAPLTVPAAAPALAVARPAVGALQVHESYIVTEDDEGLVIIDQHALHERVMFEKLLERVARGTLEGQRLLLPAAVDVDGGQLEALSTLAPLLARLGIEAEPLGPSTVAVHAFTTLLFERGVDPVTFMRELLARAADDGLSRDPEAALHEVLDMMACKAAVKAGDHLEPREIEELLRARVTVERSSNCPHGRPTTLRLSLDELARQFGRR